MKKLPFTILPGQEDEGLTRCGQLWRTLHYFLGSISIRLSSSGILPEKLRQDA